MSQGVLASTRRAAPRTAPLGALVLVLATCSAGCNPRSDADSTPTDAPRRAEPAPAPPPPPPPPPRWVAELSLERGPDVYERDRAELRRRPPPAPSGSQPAHLWITQEGSLIVGGLEGRPAGALRGERLDDGRLHLRLTGDEIRGWLVAEPAGGGWNGRLHLARFDGSESWQAEVRLAPASSAAPPSAGAAAPSQPAPAERPPSPSSTLTPSPPPSPR